MLSIPKYVSLYAVAGSPLARNVAPVGHFLSGVSFRKHYHARDDVAAQCCLP